MRFKSELLLVAAVLIVSGCATINSNRDGTNPAIGWKVVMEKSAPAYLIAVDRSECTVPTDRFERVAIGDRVFCAWRRTGSIARWSGAETPPRGGTLPPHGTLPPRPAVLPR